MRTHLAGVNLRTGATVAQHADEPVTSASIIKVPVMVHVLQAVDAGSLALDAVAPLVRPMIAVSSNEATNDLLNLVGIPAVQETITAIGMGSTRIRRKMMDMEARAAGRENTTTADDVRHLFEAIAAGSLLSATTQALAVECLLAQELGNLPVPPHYRWAHKTGELAGVRHDAGILLDAAGPVAVVVALLSELDLGDEDDTDPGLFDAAGAQLARELTLGTPERPLSNDDEGGPREGA